MKFTKNTILKASGFKTSTLAACLLAATTLFHLPAEAAGDSKNPYTLRGIILDAGNERDPVPGTTIFIQELGRGAAADVAGLFNIPDLPEGRYEARISSVGYITQNVQINIPSRESVVRIYLQPSLVEMNEVIITASPNRSAANYQSSQAFNTMELIRRTSVSLGEMLDGEPGLASRSFGGGPARPVIRGFDGERLVVLENGERMGDIQSTAPDHAITLDPLGMSRVEVVRGPASLLYGSSALGGVINIFTEDAPTDWEQGLSGGAAFHGASNNNLYSSSAGIIRGGEHHGVAARLILRSAGNSHTPDDIMPNTQMDSYTASLGWGYRNNRFSSAVSARYYQNHYGVPEFASMTDPDSERLMFIEEEPDMEIRINRWNMQARANIELDGFFDEIEARTSFSHSVQEEGEQGVPYEFLELEITTTTVSSSALFMHREFSVFDRGVVGTNLHRRLQEVDGLEAYHPGEDIYNLAIFTFQEIPLGQHFRMQFGLRAEHEWLSSVSNRYFLPEEQTKDKNLNLVGSLGLNFRPGERLESGLQIARAHRNPTILERYADGWHAGATRVELGDPTLKSEYGYGLDFFTRYTGPLVHIELSGFYNRIDNYVALLTLDPVEAVNIPYRVRPDREFPATVQFFAADARLFGFEFRKSVLVTEALRLELGMDYVQGDRRDADKPLPFIPPFRTTVGSMYTYNNFNIGGSLRMVAAQNRVPGDELPTDGYSLLRLEAGYRFPALFGGMHTINLRVDNALDARYQDHLSVVRRYKDPFLGPSAPTRHDMPGRNINLVYRILF